MGLSYWLAEKFYNLPPKMQKGRVGALYEAGLFRSTHI